MYIREPRITTTERTAVRKTMILRRLAFRALSSPSVSLRYLASFNTRKTLKTLRTLNERGPPAQGKRSPCRWGGSPECPPFQKRQEISQRVFYRDGSQQNLNTEKDG
jgi:hypothetical protein